MFVYRKILVIRWNCSGVPFGLKDSPGQGSMLFFFKVTDGRISGCWDLKQFCHFVRTLSVLFRPLRLLCWTMDANIGFWRMAGCKYLASLCVTHSWLLLPTYYNTSAVPSQCCLCQFWFLHAEHPIPFSIFHVSGIQRWTAQLLARGPQSCDEWWLTTVEAGGSVDTHHMVGQRGNWVSTPWKRQGSFSMGFPRGLKDG